MYHIAISIEVNACNFFPVMVSIGPGTRSARGLVFTQLTNLCESPLAIIVRFKRVPCSNPAMCIYCRYKRRLGRCRM
ncbi:hypothetical protein B0J17DRAFT_372941 [Rhizoctonia solani]|nr:hypothetical protein B0J17DRAFT_372941 [Rhizoctonia solani]